MTIIAYVLRVQKMRGEILKSVSEKMPLVCLFPPHKGVIRRTGPWASGLQKTKNVGVKKCEKSWGDEMRKQCE